MTKTANKTWTPKMTRNPFLNFLRSYRVHLIGRRQAEIVQIGAKHWNLLSEDEKFEFYRKAMLFKRKQVLSEH